MNYDKMCKIQLSSVYGKIVKSYALDDESIGILDKASEDLGVKSRSETLRYIIKEFEKWKKDKQHNAQN